MTQARDEDRASPAETPLDRCLWWLHAGAHGNRAAAWASPGASVWPQRRVPCSPDSSSQRLRTRCSGGPSPGGASRGSLPRTALGGFRRRARTRDLEALHACPQQPWFRPAVEEEILKKLTLSVVCF